ncbi:MAG TPA: hypothetical protein VGJ69_01395 [Pyrinomonadaceae bacterium]
MREFVGVKSPLDLLIEVISTRLPVENVFKREAMMFGRIACPQLDKMVAAFEALGSSAHPLSAQLHSIATGFFSHVDYLRKHNIVFDDVSSADGPAVDFLKSDSEFASLMTVENRIAPWALEAIQNAGLDDFLDQSNITIDEDTLNKVDRVGAIFFPLVVVLQLITRKVAVQLRVLNGSDACPVFSEIVPPIPLQVPEKTVDVVNLTIDALPTPDSTVSWEQIIEFRSDPDSQNKFLELRNWMSEVGRGDLTPNEINLRLEVLINRYRAHMNLHRMKTHTGKLQTVIAAATNLLRGNLLDATSALFSYKNQRVGLLEAELTAPGREVAYIVAARERFRAGSQGSIK